MEFGLEFIKKLQPCSWKYKPGLLCDGKEHLGLIAQDVNEIVDKEEYAFVVHKNGYYAINYHEFVGPLIKSIQQLEEKVEFLEFKIEKEQKRIDDIIVRHMKEIDKSNYPK